MFDFNEAYNWDAYFFTNEGESIYDLIELEKLIEQMQEYDV